MPIVKRRVSIQVLCPARPKNLCLYVVSKDLNVLHDNADLDSTTLDPIVLLLWLLVLHLLLWLVLLLLLSGVLHLLLLARVSARHRVRRSMVRLSVLRMLRLMLLAVVKVRHLRWTITTGFQLNINAAFVVLRVILQTQLATDLLHARLDLLHVVDRVVSLADDYVQVRLAALLGVTDALLEDLLGFFDVLAVQVNGIAVYFADGVVFAEDEFGGLLVVFVGFCCVILALLRQFVRLAAVAALIGLLGLRGEVLVLALLFAGEVAQTVVFAFRF
jgi:hypothetical protein